MDLILALMPIKIARSLSRPFREKVLISCLMALGLCATAIAGVKMTTFNDVGLGDQLYDSIKPSLYAKLEEQVGIIAACAPCLKAPVERLLRRVGVLSERDPLSKPSFVITSGTREAVTMGSLHHGDAESESTSRIYTTGKNDSVGARNGNPKPGNERREDWGGEWA